MARHMLSSDKGQRAGLPSASPGPPGAPAVGLAISARYSQDSGAPPTAQFARSKGGKKKRAGGGPKQPPPCAAGPLPRGTLAHQDRAGPGRQQARPGSNRTGREGPWVQAQCSVGLHTGGRAQLCLEPPLGWSGLVRGPSGAGQRPFQWMPTPGRDPQSQPQPVSLRAHLVPPPAPAPGRMAQVPRSGKSSPGYPGKKVAKDMRLRRSLGLPFGDPAPRQAQGGLNTELPPCLEPARLVPCRDLSPPRDPAAKRPFCGELSLIPDQLSHRPDPGQVSGDPTRNAQWDSCRAGSNHKAQLHAACVSTTCSPLCTWLTCWVTGVFPRVQYPAVSSGVWQRCWGQLVGQKVYKRAHAWHLSARCVWGCVYTGVTGTPGLPLGTPE